MTEDLDQQGQDALLTVLDACAQFHKSRSNEVLDDLITYALHLRSLRQEARRTYDGFTEQDGVLKLYADIIDECLWAKAAEGAGKPSMDDIWHAMRWYVAYTLAEFEVEANKTREWAEIFMNGYPTIDEHFIKDWLEDQLTMHLDNTLNPEDDRNGPHAAIQRQAYWSNLRDSLYSWFGIEIDEEEKV